MPDPTTTPQTPPPRLTDEQLLELAEKNMEDDYGAINSDEYDPLDERYLEVSVNELLAFARAAIAADRAAQPQLSPEAVEARFRAWFQREHGLPPSPTATAHAAAFALHLLGEVGK